mgnify:CR=1 FL=1
MVFLLLFLVQVPANAHHSYAKYYTDSEMITISGVVTRFDFRNPHVFIYLNVVDTNGTSSVFAVESLSASVLRRQGWSKESFQVGESITVSGPPARKSTTALFGRIFVKADGEQIVVIPSGR